jgi:hypothetical protein
VLQAFRDNISVRCVKITVFAAGDLMKYGASFLAHGGELKTSK